MSTRLRGLGWALVGVLALVCAACTPATPAIVATPDNVMVNSTVALAGTGFPDSATIQLEECGATSWAVASDPCLTGGGVTVTTSSTGTFSTAFKLVICPLVGPPPVPVTARTCYVGEPTASGADDGQLTGAEQVTVTYP